MNEAHASPIVLALALATLAGCASAAAPRSFARPVTVGEIISGPGFDGAEQIEVTGRLHRGAARSVFLVDPAYELDEDQRVPSFAECLHVATTAAESKSLERYDGQVLTLVGSVVSVPVRPEALMITITLEGTQQIHLHCQYPLEGGVVPIIDLASWRRP